MLLFWHWLKFKQLKIYELITPFVPAPIIDMLVKQGFEASAVKKGDQICSYFRKASAT